MRTPVSLFQYLLARLDASSDETPDIPASELKDWPQASVDDVISAGLLRSAPPATWIRCPACDDDHDAEVERVETTQGVRPFVLCPVNGRVFVEEADLAMWAVSADSIVNAIQRALHLDGNVVERRRGRAWQLGRGRIGNDQLEFWLLNGLGARDAATTFSNLSFANAWAFVIGDVHTVAWMPVRQLAVAEYLRLEDGQIIVDLAHLAKVLGKTDPKPPAAYLFHRVGDYWDLGYDGEQIPAIKNMKGLSDIAWLLRHPGQEIAATDLMGTATLDSAVSPMKTGELTIHDGHGVPLADLDTRDAVLGRREELREEIAAATERGAIDEVQKLRDEEDDIRRYLGSITNKAGQLRATPGARENARTAVTKRINVSIRAIRKRSPAMGAHLDRSIVRGTTLVYQPETPVQWGF